MSGLKGDVGRQQSNYTTDVHLVQQLLVRHSSWLLPASAPAVSGKFDTETEQAIRVFQKNAGSVLAPDGIVSRNGFTITRLEATALLPPKSRVFLLACWDHAVNEVTATDYEAAARTLGIEVEAA